MSHEYMEKVNTIHKESPSVHETLLLTYLRNEASEEEVIAVEQWLATDMKHQIQLEQLAVLYFTQQAHHRISSRNVHMAYHKVCRHIAKKSERITIRRIAIAAASVALLIMVSWTTYLFMRDTIPELQQVTVQTNPGMRTQFNLPDGTLVVLNGGSSFSYSIPFGAEERHVVLDGEGFFCVAHDTKHPFYVNTPGNRVRIKVLGTEFNVQAYREDAYIRTTLVNGSVSLNIRGENDRKIVRTLSPSECAVYDLQSKCLNVSHVNTTYDTAWKDGKLIFKDTPLPDVLRRLSHFYNVSFEIRDSLIENNVFTGTFINRQLLQILEYLRITSRINYEIAYPTEDDSHEINQTKVILTK